MANQMCDDLVPLLEPWFIEVVGEVAVRGRVHTVVKARHDRRPE